MSAEAADRPFLNSHQQFVLARQTKDEIGVQRLGKTRIGDSGRNAVGRENLRSLRAFGKARAERQQRNRRAFRDNAPASDRKRHTARGKLDADTIAARIAQRGGRSSICAAVATMCTSSASSAAAMMTN